MYRYRTQWMVVAAAILIAIAVFFFISRYGPKPTSFSSSSSSPDGDGGLQFNRDRTREIGPDARPALPPAEFVPGPVDSEHLVGIWSTDANAEYIGNDIMATRSTVKECQRRCELTASCVGISHNKFDGFYTKSCWLKSDMPPTARVRNTERESLRLTNRSS